MKIKDLVYNIKKFSPKKDDFIVVTIGDKKHQVFPTEEDIQNWRDLLVEFLPNNINGLVIPDFAKFKKEKPTDGKINVEMTNLEYLEYMNWKNK